MSSAATKLVETANARKAVIPLAQVFSPSEEALSFYFCSPAVSDKTHREERITVRDMVQDVSRRSGPDKHPSFTKDLEYILSATDTIQRDPKRLHVIFACGNQGIWREFDLSVAAPQSSLQSGRRFSLLPLMRALDAVTPYGVVLIESGKARAFVIRGSEATEQSHRLPGWDLRLRVQDSRVGWSSHIEGNQIEHERAYFKELAHRLSDFMVEQNISQLVIGCRDDLWGEQIEPHFTGLEEHHALIGRFQLPRFEISTPEVLRLATSYFAQFQRSRIEDTLHHISEVPSRGVYGINDVSRCLRESRVQCLVLGGRLPDQTLSDCGSCGNISPSDAQRCIFCGGTHLFALAAEEGLLRQALFTDAEILCPEETSHFRGVAALLRY